MVGHSKRKVTIQAFFYLLPALAVIFGFVIFPLVRSFYMSFFTDYNIFKHTGSGFGLINYVEVMKDDLFILAVKNTALYTAVVVPVSIAISLFIAVLLNNKMRGMKFFETMYFLPYITNVIAIGLAFRFIFHSNYGVLNILMTKLGMEPIVWLNDAKYALPALMIFGIWGGLAFKIVVFLAGLQGIDKQYYQAAKIDSASRWQTFSKITLPLLSPMIMYITVISLIGAFKVYVEVVGLYGGRPGPANSAMTIVYYVYERFYGSQEPTIAAAASVLMFGMILILTFLQLALNKRRVHY